MWAGALVLNKNTNWWVYFAHFMKSKSSSSLLSHVKLFLTNILRVLKAVGLDYIFKLCQPDGSLMILWFGKVSFFSVIFIFWSVNRTVDRSILNGPQRLWFAKLFSLFLYITYNPDRHVVQMIKFSSRQLILMIELVIRNVINDVYILLPTNSFMLGDIGEGKAGDYCTMWRHTQVG